MGQRFKANGKIYDIPDDRADDFVNSMEARGIAVGGIDEPDGTDDQPEPTSKFQADGKVYDIPTSKVEAFQAAKPHASAVPPERQQPEDTSPNVVDNPQATVQAGMPEQGPPSAPNQLVEPQSPSWLSGIVAKIGEMYGDAGRAQDESGAEASKLREADMLMSQGRAAAGGAVRGATLDYANPYKQDQADNPGVAAMGSAAGGMVNPVQLATNAVLPGAGGLGAGLARAGINAMSGGAQGVISKYNELDPNDQDRVSKSLQAGPMSAAFSGGASVAGDLLGAGARAGEQGAENMYSRNRLKAGNVGDKELQAFGGKRGISNPDEAGAAMAREFDSQVPPNAIFGRSPGEIGVQARARAGELNSDINGALAQAQAAGAQIQPTFKDDVAFNLRGKSFDARDAAGGAQSPMVDHYRSIADNLEDAKAITTPQQLRAMKMGYDKRAYPGDNASVPEKYDAQVSKQVADEARQGLQTFANADPAAGAAYNAANRGYEAVAPFAQGASTEGFKNAVGGTPNGGAGFFGKMGDLASNMLPSPERLPDMKANMAGPIASTFQGIGDAAGWLTREAGVAGAQLQQAGGDIVKALMGGPKVSQGQQPEWQMPDSNGPRSDASDVMDPQRTYDNSRGHLGYEQADKMFMDNKGNDTFQPWASAMSEIDIDDRNQFMAKWEKLLRTDDEFQRRVDMLRNQGMG